MSKYLKYTIKNTAPIRIADDETSQRGQTDTLRYFPGSTIRGYVMTQLANNNQLEDNKQILFSGKVSFLNAYPSIDGREMIPSLKGYYEDKSEKAEKKELNNVLFEDVIPGYKRAALGHFCYLEDDCIRYADVEVSEDVNINTGKEDVKRNVFRSQYIKKNQTFSGYIVFQDEVSEDLINLISETFDQAIYLGNRRSAGYGACVCIGREVKQGLPYQEIRTAQGAEDLYMLLLSDTVMRDQFGELTGLCLEELAEKLGCKCLKIERCATSITDVRGYNRIWEGAIPSAVMYEAGSVFHLKASEPIPEEKLHQLENNGIGIRRDEGFGQIAFLKDYTKIRYKLAVSTTLKVTCGVPSWGKEKEIAQDLKIAAQGLVMQRLEAATNRYITEQKNSQKRKYDLSRISSSKRGLLMSMCQQLRYQPSEAKSQLMAFVSHENEKNNKVKIHDGKKRQDVLYRYVKEILEGDLFQIVDIEWKNECVFGIQIQDLLPADRMIQYKLNLMIRQLKLENRGGK